MNPLLILVAKYTRDLLAYDEQLIRIGRENFDQTDFKTGYITVDQLGPASHIAHTQGFDPNAEMLTLGATSSAEITLDFYGTGAYTRANSFMVLQRSQAARDLRKTLGLTVYLPSAVTDVKQLTGQQYGERVQMVLTAWQHATVDIPTLRIDIAQIEIRTEQGVQYSGESQ